MYQFSEAQSCLIDYFSVGWPGLTDTGMLLQQASVCAEFPQQLNKLQLIYLFLKNLLTPKKSLLLNYGNKRNRPQMFPAVSNQASTVKHSSQ